MLTIEPDVSLVVSMRVYPRAALFRTCYLFTGKCWIWLAPVNDDEVAVNLLRKDAQEDVTILQREFANALIDHAVRWEIDSETRDMRSLVMAAALGEATRG
jgi:His-Xaa-Ser system protein HxsD